MMTSYIYEHHNHNRQAEVSFYQEEKIWVVEIQEGNKKRVHGLYPSLSSAQLILVALGFSTVA